jgi:2-haloacid dehalogenase
MPAPAGPFRAAVFDLGAVLIDWNPRHLYRKLFDDEPAMERFLADVYTLEWNAQMDAGRPFADAVAELIVCHPSQADLIRAVRERWGEMLRGCFDDVVAIVRELRAAGVPVYALSNWSAETFPIARQCCPFLDELDGVLISGQVGIVKPDREIFRIFLQRFGLEPGEIVFIDDSQANVDAARTLGIESIRFENAEQTRRELIERGFPLAPQS